MTAVLLSTARADVLLVLTPARVDVSPPARRRTGMVMGVELFCCLRPNPALLDRGVVHCQSSDPAGANARGISEPDKSRMSPPSVQPGRVGLLCRLASAVLPRFSRPGGPARVRLARRLADHSRPPLPDAGTDTAPRSRAVLCPFRVAAVSPRPGPPAGRTTAGRRRRGERGHRARRGCPSPRGAPGRSARR